MLPIYCITQNVCRICGEIDAFEWENFGKFSRHHDFMGKLWQIHRQSPMLSQLLCFIENPLKVMKV